jgi:hypothetical protein
VKPSWVAIAVPAKPIKIAKMEIDFMMIGVVVKR